MTKNQNSMAGYLLATIGSLVIAFGTAFAAIECNILLHLAACWVGGLTVLWAGVFAERSDNADSGLEEWLKIIEQYDSEESKGLIHNEAAKTEMRYIKKNYNKKLIELYGIKED